MWFVFSLQLAKFQTFVGTNRVRKEAKIQRRKKNPPDLAAQILPRVYKGPKRRVPAPGGKLIPRFPLIYLHQLVPAAGDDDGVAAVRGEAHARHPLRVALVLGRATRPGLGRGNGARFPPFRPTTSPRSAAPLSPLIIAGLVLNPPQKGRSGDIVSLLIIRTGLGDLDHQSRGETRVV